VNEVWNTKTPDEKKYADLYGRTEKDLIQLIQDRSAEGDSAGVFEAAQTLKSFYEKFPS
jgi:hypothetical protein